MLPFHRFHVSGPGRDLAVENVLLLKKVES